MYRILHIFTAWLCLQTETERYFAGFLVTDESETMAVVGRAWYNKLIILLRSMTMPQLMTKEEIHEFGLQILSRYLEANAYEIEMMHPNMQMFPHIIAKKNGQLVFIIAATDVYPNKGSFADSEKAALLENAAKFDAQAACAYLGIANAAGAKAKDKELCGKAYKDADFLTDFGGLEFIYFKD